MKVYIVGRKLFRSIMALVLAFFVLTLMMIAAPIYQSVYKPNKILPIYNVQMSEKKVALSFDAAWGADDTPYLLDALKKYKAKATFFLVGRWAEKFPVETKAISDMGNEVGNHSYTHPDMTKLSEEDMKNEILKANEAIEKVIQKKVTIYRPPYGAYNNTTMRVLNSLNVETIQWDVDSLDWKDLSAQQILNRVVPKVKPGSIVLFHNNAKHTAEALPMVLEALQKQGYQFVTVSELIIKDKSRYYIDHRGTQIPKEPDGTSAPQNNSTTPSAPKDNQKQTTPDSSQKVSPSSHTLDPEFPQSEPDVPVKGNPPKDTKPISEDELNSEDVFVITP